MHGQRSLDVGLRLRVPAAPLGHQADQVQGLGVAGHQPERLFAVAKRLVQLAGLEGGQAQAQLLHGGLSGGAGGRVQDRTERSDVLAGSVLPYWGRG